MINLFNHYVPGRMVVLAIAEALVSLIAAYVVISLDLGSAVSSSGIVLSAPSQAGAFAVGTMIVLTSMGLYQPDLGIDGRSVRARLMMALLFGFGVMGLLSYLMPIHYPRPFALGATIMIFAFAGSFLVRAAFYKWNKLDVLKPRVLVLGTGSRVMKLAEFAKRNSTHQVIGYISLQPSKHYVPSSKVLAMAPEDSLQSIVHKHAIDQIVVGVRDRRAGGFPVQQLLECRMKGVQVMELSTYFEREYRQVLLESLSPSWMVLGDGFRQGYFANAVKRLFDLIVSATLFVLTLPIILVTALLIYLESGLPIFYRQERVGKGGRPFILYKLRSMKPNAENGGAAHWAKADDDRITGVGRFIRKYRIDELPQIFNVLKGEMSLIGPRPERPFFVDQLTKQIPFYALRHSAKPGITGWAQVRYQYGASIDDAIEKLQYDLYYVKNHSFFLDLMILIATVEVVLWGKGAR
jgi:sugar transferase (PEP-CTERM system associated)